MTFLYSFVLVSVHTSCEDFRHGFTERRKGHVNPDITCEQMLGRPSLDIRLPSVETGSRGTFLFMSCRQTNGRAGVKVLQLGE